MRRLATPADLEEVFSIYMHTQVVPYLGYDPMPLSDFRAVFDGLLASRCFYVYEEDDSGRISGFYQATRYPGRARHVALLGALAVRPELHGSGVARRMITEAIAQLRAEGVKRIELQVETDNPRAIRFYEQLGFEKEAVLHKAYKRAHEAHYVDEQVMCLLFD